jgi:hypothetical protein
MGIGEDKEYVLMSDVLQDEVSFAPQAQATFRNATLQFSDLALNFPILSIELEGNGSFVLCCPAGLHRDRFLSSLIAKARLRLLLLEEEFKAEVFKIESDTCYLRLTR